MPPAGDVDTTAASDSDFHVGQYIQVVADRWRWIVLACLLSVALGLLHFFLTPRLYRAQTTLQIEQRSLLSLGGERNPWLDAWAGRKYYPTQYRLLESRGLAERVAINLELYADSRFNPRSLPSDGDAKKTDAGPSNAEIASIASRILANLTVKPDTQTELVELIYISPSPELASIIVNGVADAYIDWGIQTRTDDVGRASSFLQQQIDTLKSEIDEKERQLQEYGRDSDIVNLDPESNATLQRLAELNQSQTEAIRERLEMQALYNALMNAAPEDWGEVQSSPMVESLRRELLDLERDYEAKLRIYKPDWPEMVSIRTRIEEARENVKIVGTDEMESLRRRAHSDYQAALRQERTLDAQIERAKGEAMDLSSASVEYENLEMEITNRRDLLEDLSKRLSEAGISASLQNTRESNVRVVDRALEPGGPFRPSLRVDVTISLALGLLLGVGVILLVHFLDRTIKTSEELERILGHPVLTVIPEVSAGARAGRYGYYAASQRDKSERKGVRSLAKQRRKKSEPAAELDIELVPHTHSRLAVSEAYRALRTALLLSSADQLKVISITSAEANEGKTATATNLSVVMAQLGRRVLIVDADLRKSRLHHIFGVSNRVGLVNYLTSPIEGSEILIPTSLPNLTFCPAGPHPPNPSELLASERMADFVTLVRERFDTVIIDTPPVMMVTDAILAGSMSDGIVLCFRAHKILREQVRNSRDRLELSDVKVLGAVLNRHRPVGSGYYSGKYYYKAYDSYVTDDDETVGSAA